MKNRFFHPTVNELCRFESIRRLDLPSGLIDLPLISGETLLGRMVSDGTMTEVKELLAKGADVDATDLRGIPPIIHAAIAKRIDNLQLLLKHGAKADTTDANGRTALHYAFLFGDIEMALSLLNCEADLFLHDVDGRTIIDYARAVYGDKDVNTIASIAQNFIVCFKAVQGIEEHELDDVDRDQVADLRGDSDFKRLDRIRTAMNFGINGIGSQSLICIFGVCASAMFFGDLVVAGVVLYVCLVMRLVLVFLNESTTPPPKFTKGVPGASVREVSFILRVASHHILSRLDKGTNKPAKTVKFELLIWLFVFVVPLASVVACALLIGLAYIASLLLFQYSNLVELLVLMIGLVVLFLAPRLIVWGTEYIFSYGANTLIVRKVTARQTALSNHINARRELRQGGNFADGGVLYLRSFEFDGSFVSDGLDFELMLLHLFEGHAPIFALNAEAQSRGVLNIKTDDADWRSVLRDMLPRAGLILMIPASSPGVLDEMKLLKRDGCFNKTLFIAPPENDDCTVGKAWEAMRLRPDFRDFEIPPYCDAGFLFRLDKNGMLAEAGPLGIDRSPTPLVPMTVPFENKAGPNEDGDDAGGDENADTGDGLQDGGGVFDDGSAPSAEWGPTPDFSLMSSNTSSSSSSNLATSSAQFVSLSLLMQAVPQLSAEQFTILSGTSPGGDGGDGGDGGGGDGGGGGGG